MHNISHKRIKWRNISRGNSKEILYYNLHEPRENIYEQRYSEHVGRLDRIITGYFDAQYGPPLKCNTGY